MSQIEKAKEFAALHVRGRPIILYNAWDAGSAKAIADAGAKAIATSSWAVAAAQGFKDGEDISLALVERVAGRIVATVDKPVTIDFEGGYGHKAVSNLSRAVADWRSALRWSNRPMASMRAQRAMSAPGL